MAHANSLQHWLAHFIPQPLESALSIGCGFGAFERSLVKLEGAKQLLGVDLSAGAIARATAAAEREGLTDRIRYEAVDMNAYEPPPSELRRDLRDILYSPRSCCRIGYGPTMSSG